jgi:hypothetical protein
MNKEYKNNKLNKLLDKLDKKLSIKNKKHKMKIFNKFILNNLNVRKEKDVSIVKNKNI